MNTLKDLGHDKVLHSVFQILDLLLGGVSLSVEVQMKMKINMKSTIAVYPATNFSIEPRFDNFNFLEPGPTTKKTWITRCHKNGVSK